MRQDLRATLETDLARTGGSTWRSTQRELYRYLRRDMSDARTQRAALYPKNHAKHVLRTVPFLWRLAREMSSVDRARSWTAPDGAELPAETINIIENIYREAQIDRRMRTAHEQLVGLNQATIHVWPNERTQGVTLFVPPPHDQEVEQVGIVSLDERDVKTWWLRVALQRDAQTGLVQYGIAKVSRIEACWEEAPRDWMDQPLWRGQRANPLGEIPVVMLRGSDPAPGEWWAPVAEDLLDAQRAIIHDQTDLGVIARLQGFSQAVIKGVSLASAKEIFLSPEEAIGIPETGDFQFVSPSPDLQGNVDQLTQYVQTVLKANGLNPSSTKTDGITAVAKQIELIDRDTERRRHFVEFARAEQRVYDLVRAWINVQRGFELLPEAKVTVEYRDVYIPADPLHEAQASELKIKLRLSSPQRELSKQDGISLADAMTKCQANADMSAELGLGADAIAVEDAPAALDVGAAANVQQSALNGAQVTSLQSIAEAVVAGRLPPAAARELITMAFPVDAAAVQRLIAALSSFTPPAVTTTTPVPT